MNTPIAKTEMKQRSISVEKPRLVVGKIYADWCGHCQTLAPKWDIFDKEIKKRFPSNTPPIVYAVEESDMNDSAKGLDTLTQYLSDPTEKVAVNNGYPTIFKIVNGTLSYYEGPREVGDMIKWTMSGLRPKSRTISKKTRKGKRGYRQRHTRRNYVR